MILIVTSLDHVIKILILRLTFDLEKRNLSIQEEFRLRGRYMYLPVLTTIRDR